MKKNKFLKRGLIILGVLAFVILIANFGLNLWLKYKLPDYVRNNSDYKISYKTLDVDLGTGNIFASGITVNSKNPDNRQKLGLQGTIDTLKVNRFGIVDAVFNKEITTSGVDLIRPNLNVILADRKKNGQKKQTDINLDYLKIKDGNIDIYKDVSRKFVSVKNLNLDVEEIESEPANSDNPIPFVFKKHHINAEKVYFRPDNIYAMTADKIATKDGLMSILNYRLIPLLTYTQFKKFYPKKRNLFDFYAHEMKFKDIDLSKKKLVLSQVEFTQPNLKMHTSQARPQEKTKSFKYIVNLDDVSLKNGNIEILKPNGSRLFNVEKLNMNISKIAMDDETAKGNIPFKYEKFKIDGTKINYISETENIKVAAAAANSKSADLRYISIQPTSHNARKTAIAATVKNINFLVNDWGFENNKLKLDAKRLLVDQANGRIIAPTQKAAAKKLEFKDIAYPVKLENLSVKNSNIVYEKANKPLALNQLNISVDKIELNEETVKHGIPFKTENFSLIANSLVYNINPFYKLATGKLNVNKKNLSIAGFSLKPLVARSQFIKMIPTEKDLYDLSASSISMKGDWDLISSNQYINASDLSINNLNANIFRSKVPKDDPTIKPMYSELLRKIKFPMFIANMNVRNSILEYEEDTPTSEGPGKLTFGNFNMNIKNLNSGKTKGKPTQIPITINCAFMNASPMKVNWGINTASMDDAFTISGTISNLPATRINAFIEPYLKVRATGNISELLFNFKGNKNGIGGKFNMKHQDLRVSLLREDGEKKKVLSAIANMVVKSSSSQFPESVDTGFVKRDPTKSFFNMFWKGIQEGLKKTLVGDLMKAKNTVDNTVSTAKDVKTGVKSTVSDVKDAVKDVTKSTEKTSESKPKKEGFLKRVFKKKDEQKESQ